MRHRSRSRAPAGRRLNSLAGGTIFTPASIPGLVLWLDPTYGLYQETTGASAATPAVADGDPVGTWKARVGGVYLTATASGNRPVLRLDGGHRYLEFNGTSSYLTAPSAAILQAKAAGLTLAAWLKVTTANNQTAVGKNSSSDREYYLRPTIGSTVQFNATAAGGLTTTIAETGSNTIPAGTRMLAVGRFDPALAEILASVGGGAAAATAFAGPVFVGTGNFTVGRDDTFGGGEYYAGRVGDVLKYDRPIADAETSSLSAWGF